MPVYTSNIFAGVKMDMDAGVSAQQAKASDTEHTRPSNSTFFKIIVSPPIQLRNLRIPRAFIEKFGKSLLDHAYLRVPDGAEWKVYLQKHEGGVSFDEGWSEFANHYSLALGHFLVSKYEGNSEFEVVIFDTTGTEIEYAQNTTTNTETGEILVSDPGTHRLGRGESSAVERAKAFKSSNPHFTIVLRPSHLRRPSNLPVPAWYAKEQMNKEKYFAVRLQAEQTGRTWSAKGYFDEPQGKTRVHIRWRNFARDNKLKEGDVCVFELISKTTNTYRVTIFRC